MAYIQVDELKTAIYEYQLSEITENDNTIVLQAIEAAQQEVYGYLNNLYDTAIIFDTIGTDRNALLVEITKDIAVWWIIRLSSVDLMHDHIRERYDRAISWLKGVAAGKISPDLPNRLDGNNVSSRLRFGGTNRKFNHYI